MYSDSIKQKQQELLDVLFKKANGPSFTSPSNQLGNSRSGFGKKTVSAIDRADAGSKNKDIIEYTKLKGPQPIFGEAARAWKEGFDEFVKEQNRIRYEEGRRKSEESNKDLERDFRLSNSDSYKDSLQNVGDLAKKIEPGKATIDPVSSHEQNSSTPVLPVSEKHIVTEVPPVDIPEPKPIDPTPEDPKPATKAPEDPQKGNPEIDPIALAKALFDKAMRHKATSLGGLGGAGLGLMLGKSIPGRLLWGLLGGLGGAGLGYAAEKYIK